MKNQQIMVENILILKMIKLRGHIEVDNGVRIKTNSDVCRYYQWLFNKHHFNTIKNQNPKHGGHISVLLPKIHGINNFDKLKFLQGKEVWFYIDPTTVTVTRKNCWIRVELKDEALKIANFIKKTYGIKDDDRFWGYHMVVLNFKGG